MQLGACRAPLLALPLRPAPTRRAIWGSSSGHSSPSGSSCADSAADLRASSRRTVSAAKRDESSARPGATGRGWPARACAGGGAERSVRRVGMERWEREVAEWQSSYAVEMKYLTQREASGACAGAEAFRDLIRTPGLNREPCGPPAAGTAPGRTGPL